MYLRLGDRQCQTRLRSSESHKPKVPPDARHPDILVRWSVPCIPADLPTANQGGGIFTRRLLRACTAQEALDTCSREVCPCAPSRWHEVIALLMEEVAK